MKKFIKEFLCVVSAVAVGLAISLCNADVSTFVAQRLVAPTASTFPNLINTSDIDADVTGVTTSGPGIVAVNTANNSTFGMCSYGASANAARIPILKTRSTSATCDANTIVTSGDELGAIVWYGSNGSSFTPAAAIYGFSDGTPGASNDMPGRISMYTTADGSGSLTEHFRLWQSGQITVSSGSNQPAAAQTGTSLHVYSGASGATKPTNTELEVEGTGNGGVDNSGNGSSSRGYYFSNPTASYDGGIEYTNSSRTGFLRAGGTQIVSFTSTALATVGTFTSSRTSDLGWTVQAAANQACNTTCVSACVVGLDNGTNTFVSCATATADQCLCAGAS